MPSGNVEDAFSLKPLSASLKFSSKLERSPFITTAYLNVCLRWKVSDNPRSVSTGMQLSL